MGKQDKFGIKYISDEAWKAELFGTFVNKERFNARDVALEELRNNLTNKLEQVVIEGLKLKGFVFENKNELVNFVKEHVRIEDNVEYQEKVYYVKDIPFLLHRYQIVIEPPTEINRSIVMSANIGHYCYL